MKEKNIPVRMMPLREFAESGYMQEVNRQFMHPLGLTFVVELDVMDKPVLVIEDHRDQEDGCWFDFKADDKLAKEKARAVWDEQNKRAGKRFEKCGAVIEPLPSVIPEAVRQWVKDEAENAKG